MKVPAEMLTRKTRTSSRGEKTDAMKVTAPTRHDGARQALSELRRIVDAERKRFKGKFIPMRNKIRQDQHRRNDAWGESRVTNENLMADALRFSSFCRGAFI